MVNTSEQILKGRWDDYLRLHREGAVYSAFVRLAELSNCIAHLPEGGHEKWSALIERIHFSEDEIRNLKTEVDQRIRRVKRIVGVGSRFTFEELLLIVTIRTELALLSDFLLTRQVLNVVLAEELDPDLRFLLESTATAREFRKAQAAAKKNWGVPLHCRWLGDLDT